MPKKKNPGPASSDTYFWVMIPDQKRDLKKMSFWGFIFAKKFLVTELSFYMKRTSLSLDRTSVKQSSFIKMTFFCRVSQNDFFFLSCLLAGRMLGAQIVFSIVSVATINVRSVFHYMQHIYNPRLTHSSFSRSLFLWILNNYKWNFVDNMCGLFFFNVHCLVYHIHLSACILNVIYVIICFKIEPKTWIDILKIKFRCWYVKWS